MMRLLYLLTVVVLLSGCGGSSPATPTPVPTPTPSPTPAPPPAPVFPNLVGGWTGRVTISATLRQTGEQATNVCDQSWVIANQAGDTFSGTFQLSGGTTVSCGQSGNVTGHVSTAGAVTELDFGEVLSAAASCTRTAGDGKFSGVVSNAVTLTAQSTDTLHCTAFSPPVDGDRRLSVEMNKR